MELQWGSRRGPNINPQSELYSLSPVRLESQKMLLSPKKAPRAVSKVPFKVLDAPDLADDFYLNLVDWGSSNMLESGLLGLSLLLVGRERCLAWTWRSRRRPCSLVGSQQIFRNASVLLSADKSKLVVICCCAVSVCVAEDVLA